MSPEKTLEKSFNDARDGLDAASRELSRAYFRVSEELVHSQQALELILDFVEGRKDRQDLIDFLRKRGLTVLR